MVAVRLVEVQGFLLLDQVHAWHLLGQASAVIIEEIALGDQGQREGVAGELRDSVQLGGQVRLSLLRVWCEPAGYPVQTEMLVAHPSVGRHQGGDLVHHLLRRLDIPGRVTHVPGQVASDHPRRAGGAYRRDGLLQALDTSFQIGQGAVHFGEGGAGEHHVGVLQGLGTYNILHHQELQVGEFRQRGCFACQVKGLDLPGANPIQDV